MDQKLALLEQISPLTKFYLSYTNSLKLKLETKLAAEQKAMECIKQLEKNKTILTKKRKLHNNSFKQKKKARLEI